VQLIELKELVVFCEEQGERNIRAILVPWDGDGFVLMFKCRKDISILRTKSQPTPRIFKTISTGLGICQALGFTSVTVNFTPQKIKYEKPHWIKGDQ
jgi:hypothetical protein